MLIKNFFKSLLLSSIFVIIFSGVGTSQFISKANAQDQQQDQKLVPIDIKLPIPMFIGTPQNFRVPNLENQTD